MSDNTFGWLTVIALIVVMCLLCWWYWVANRRPTRTITTTYPHGFKRGDRIQVENQIGRVTRVTMHTITYRPTERVRVCSLRPGT